MRGDDCIMYYTNGFRDEEAEDFIYEVFKLLNGVINPNNIVPGIHFIQKFDNPLGALAFGGPNDRYIVVGSSNVREFIAEFGREQAYTLFIDFVAHELYHATQNIDIVRYQNDQEYWDAIETDCEYHTALFIFNYGDWLESHLSKNIDLNVDMSGKFLQCFREYQAEQSALMLADPWIIDM